ncbi:MAG: family 4 glycosyl hydrolase [Promethearchaeota archaeon]
MVKVAIIGAGSNVFGLRMIKDLSAHAARDGSPLQGLEVCLMDIDAQRLRYMSAVCDAMAAKYPDLPVEFSATTNRRDALRDASYVIVMIHPGGSAAIVLDNEVPKKWGERVGRPFMPSVNDTMCPGGIMRGCRTIPVLTGILDDMAEVSRPGALLMNYSNPMAMNTWAMYDLIATNGYDIHCVGLCHGTWGTAVLLRAWLGVLPSEFAYTCIGINHMAWYVDLRMKDPDTGEWVDAYPVLEEHFREDPEIANVYPDTFRIELWRQFGYYCTESSGHSSEYVPFPVRVRDDLFEKYNFAKEGKNNAKLEGALAWTPERDRQKFEEMLASPRTVVVPQMPSNEYASWIVAACETPTVDNTALPSSGPFYFHGNVRNDGLITNLPRGCCVEVPCVAIRPGWGHDRPVVPTFQGELPPQCAALCRTNVNVQELVVRACQRRDPELVKYAMMLDPMTSQVLEPAEARAMAEELLEAQAKWLPQFN